MIHWKKIRKLICEVGSVLRFEAHKGRNIQRKQKYIQWGVSTYRNITLLDL